MNEPRKRRAGQRAQGSTRGSRPRKTRERILDAGLVLFNEQGYAKTSVAQIADAAGMTAGNLWYHFHTKQDLLRALFERARTDFAACLPAVSASGPVLEDYVAHFRAVIREVWAYRFLMRDRLQFGELDPNAESMDIQNAHFECLRGLLRRMETEGLFRAQRPELDVLATNLWIVLRYWGDYLQDREAVGRVTRRDHERGFQQHLAVLAPHLTAAAQRALRETVDRARHEGHAAIATEVARAV